MSVRYYILLLAYAWRIPALPAQAPSWTWTALLHGGAIYKHTPALTIDSRGLVTGIGLSAEYQTDGSRAWARRLGQPKIGVETGWFRFADTRHLGYGIGLTPKVVLPILRRGGTGIWGSFGLGIGLVTRPYDPISNPKNNANGTHFNNFSTFRLRVDHAGGAGRSWSVGISFSHFSNGRSGLPNYGLNIPGLTLGWDIARRPARALAHRNELPVDTLVKRERRWHLWAEFSAGREEIAAASGLKYPLINAAVGLSYRHNAAQMSLAGAEYEYNYAVYNFYKFLEQYPPDKTRETGRRYALFVAHELMFGPVSFGAQLGFYVGPYRTLLPLVFYNKLNLRYYFSPFEKERPSFFVALHMKAHGSNAEYFSLGLGVSL